MTKKRLTHIKTYGIMLSDQGLFPNLTNKHLPVKKNAKKRKYDEVRSAVNNPKGTSISERDASVESRKEYGHWEMDTVVGKKGTKEVLLVLTERKTLHEKVICRCAVVSF